MLLIVGLVLCGLAPVGCGDEEVEGNAAGTVSGPGPVDDYEAALARATGYVVTLGRTVETVEDDDRAATALDRAATGYRAAVRGMTPGAVPDAAVTTTQRDLIRHAPRFTNAWKAIAATWRTGGRDAARGALAGRRDYMLDRIAEVETAVRALAATGLPRSQEKTDVLLERLERTRIRLRRFTDGE